MTAHHSSFWASTPALALIVLASAVLLALALLMLLAPSLRRQNLRARVARFIVPPTPPTSESAVEATPSEPTPGWLGRRLERHAWWSEFSEKCGIARIKRPAEKIVLMTALGTITAATAVSLLFGTPVIALPVLVLGPGTMLAIVNQRVEREQRQFGEQLASHLQEVASSMRAGHSIVGGLRTIAETAVEPMHTELERVLADEQLGVPLDAALQPMARRMASDEVKQVALVAALHERTGGNMAAVLDHVADGVRERMELRRELHSLTAQARLSRWVVTLLPPLLMLVIFIEDGAYLRPLFHTGTGVLLLVIAIGMIMVGSLVMKAIVEVET